MGSVGSSVGVEEVEQDKTDFNARAALAPTQEDVACTPCG